MSEALHRPDFNSFLVEAMQVNFSPQLGALWKIGVVTLVWAIWTARNTAIFEGIGWCSYRIMIMVKSMLMEANSTRHLGYMFNTMEDFIKLRSIGVSGNPAPPKKLIEGTWWPPPVGWVKVNTDDSAMGCPGVARAGGVFRDACGHVIACFQVSGGVAFAYEAELLGAITAIEIARSKGWSYLWLESNSSYVVGLLLSRDWRIPWKFMARWTKVLTFLESIEFRASHIYREGNRVADIMASTGVTQGLWFSSIPQIEDAVRNDMLSPRFYRYK